MRRDVRIRSKFYAIGLRRNNFAYAILLNSCRYVQVEEIIAKRPSQESNNVT